MMQNNASPATETIPSELELYPHPIHQQQQVFHTSKQGGRAGVGGVGGVTTGAVLREFPLPGGSVIAASFRGAGGGPPLHKVHPTNPRFSRSSILKEEVEAFSNHVLALPSTPSAIKQKYTLLHSTSPTKHRQQSKQRHQYLYQSKKLSPPPPPPPTTTPPPRDDIILPLVNHHTPTTTASDNNHSGNPSLHAVEPSPARVVDTATLAMDSLDSLPYFDKSESQESMVGHLGGAGEKVVVGGGSETVSSSSPRHQHNIIISVDDYAIVLQQQQQQQQEQLGGGGVHGSSKEATAPPPSDISSSRQHLEVYKLLYKVYQEVLRPPQEGGNGGGGLGLGTSSSGRKEAQSSCRPTQRPGLFDISGGENNNIVMGSNNGGMQTAQDAPPTSILVPPKGSSSSVLPSPQLSPKQRGGGGVPSSSMEGGGDGAHSSTSGLRTSFLPEQPQSSSSSQSAKYQQRQQSAVGGPAILGTAGGSNNISFNGGGAFVNVANCSQTSIEYLLNNSGTALGGRAGIMGPGIMGSLSGGGARLVRNVSGIGIVLAEHTADAESNSPRDSLLSLESAQEGGSIKEGHLTLRGQDDIGFETINNYAILQELGRGNYGKVMLACDEDGNQVAIKTMDCGVKAPKHRFAPQIFAGSSVGFNNRSLRPQQPGATQPAVLPSRDSPPPATLGLGGGPQQQPPESMVMREVAIMKKLRHKNIVQLREVIHDEEEDQTHLVMDYICNGPMAEVQPDGSCHSQQMLSENIGLAKRYMKQAAKGLEYLHSQEIVHRDIKPENVLIGAHEDAYLADFGVSAVLREDKVVDMTAGTQMFFSPELCRGDYEEAAKYGKKSDIWALGVTFYAIIFGNVPFFAPNMMTLANKILNDPLVFPDDLDPEDPLREIFKGLLHKNPKDRWSLRHLRRALADRAGRKNKKMALQRDFHSPAVVDSTSAVKSPKLVPREGSQGGDQEVTVNPDVRELEEFPLPVSISPTAMRLHTQNLARGGAPPARSNCNSPSLNSQEEEEGSIGVITLAFGDSSRDSVMSLEDSDYYLGEEDTTDNENSYCNEAFAPPLPTSSTSCPPIEVSEEEVQGAFANARVSFYRPMVHLAGGAASVIHALQQHHSPSNLHPHHPPQGGSGGGDEGARHTALNHRIGAACEDTVDLV